MFSGKMADPSRKLLQLDATIYRQIESALQRDDSWRKIAEVLREFRHLSRTKLADLSSSGNPATALLEELKCKLYEVRHLKALLQRCQLYDALAIIADPEPLEIIEQPSSFLQGREIIKVKIGNALRLQFEVRGIPPPKYTWLLNGSVISDKQSNTLIYDSYQPALEGLYTCVATQYIQERKVGEVYSQSILVETLLEAPVVVERPDSHISLCEGSPILLKIKAFGYPQPTFEWMHENEVLISEGNNTFYRAKSTKDDGGIYKCYITNRAGTEIVTINVVIYSENTTSIYSGPVTDKIALLIANDQYSNCEPLCTPRNDVAELAQIFNELGFKTLCFLNLNLHEMEVVVNIFAALITEGAYAVFYFAGHGFSAGDAYLLPVDCPDQETFMIEDAIPESQILSLVMEKQPTLCVVFLDMCLKQPNRNMGKSKGVQYESNRNLIRAYSTTSHKSAYEKRDDTNGIYVSALRKYLGERMPILAILNKVNAEIAQLCPQQMPTVSFITAEDFLLMQEMNAANPDNNIYELLNPQTTSESPIVAKKYLDVFNNALELRVHTPEILHYEINASNIELQHFSDHHKFAIFDLQKLQTDLRITVKTSSQATEQLSIQTSALATFFKNI